MIWTVQREQCANAAPSHKVVPMKTSSKGAYAAGRRWTPALYFVLGQVGWFACVLSAARNASWIGVASASALMTLHVIRVARPREEIKLLAVVMIIGGAWESLLVAAGLLSYPHGAMFPGFAPLWIVALWGLFAAQLNTTYEWLQTRIKTAALLGAVAGPLSFHAGARLGALRFPGPWAATAILAVGWGCLLPLMVILARRWNGVRLAR
jgi:hypothetical protein